MRSGNASIAKMLDIFLISEDLPSNNIFFQQWIESNSISYHNPIILELSRDPKKPPIPLKFNRT
jgi:hypothetical protein